MAQQLASAFVVEVDGAPVSPSAELVAVVIDRALHVPDLFTLTYRDTGRNALSLARAKLGARVRILVQTDASPAPQPLLDGEITALEALVDSAGRVVIVRGFDLAHRLHRSRVTTGYRNVSFADVARKVAVRAGLRPGQIEETSPVHEHVAQVDRTDAELLDGLAAEVGFETIVEGDRLHFRAPAVAAGSARGIDLTVDQPLALVVGSSLLRLHAVVRTTGQVPEVEARGWDVTAKKPLVSRAPVEASGSKPAVDPATVADAIGASGWTVPALRLGTQAEVDREAQVLARAVGDAMAELEGTARGNPKLAPGASVTVSLAGEPFDGAYVLTTVRHTFDPLEGFVTHFTVSGAERRSLLDLTGGRTGSAPTGVAPAIVEDVDDPDKRCRVRLRFPWLSEDYVSGWARSVQLGAGADRGFAWLPEPGDEVLVAFEEGDLARPYVVGGLHNGVDRPFAPPQIDPGTHAVDQRWIASRTGGYLMFSDRRGRRGIDLALEHAGGLSRVILHEESPNLTLFSTGNVSIEALGNLTLEAGRALKLRGATVEVKSDSTLALDAGAETSVKGSVVRLN